MFDTWVRLAIIAPAGSFGTVQVLRGQPQGWLLVAAALFLTYGYFRHGTIWLAYRAYSRGNLGRVHRLLDQIRFPGALRPRDRAYYEFLRGVTSRARDDLAAAERHLGAAAEGETRTSVERAFFFSQLAETQLTAKNYPAARESIRRARELEPSRFIQVLIADLEANFPEQPG